ncbi:MAG TPA: darcynin family protein [Rhodopila sp.]|jgi:hypothetical protein|nr:darcynin family protein [Rhodopila sp.]
MSDAVKVDFEAEFSVFMLVKTTPEWLGYSVDERNKLAREKLTPVLKKHADGVRMRFFDIEFYSARVTDLWMWDCKDHHSYQMLIEELREGPFWDRYFQIVEILPGVEDAYVKNYPDQQKITA